MKTVRKAVRRIRKAAPRVLHVVSKSTDHRTLFSVPEAAARLGVTTTLVYRLIRERKLRAVRRPHGKAHCWYVTDVSLDAYRHDRDVWNRMHGRHLRRAQAS